MLQVKIPSPGESISEVELATWLVADGDLVKKDQDLAEIESDKATLMLNAPESGKIAFNVEAGSTVAVGEVACYIDTSVQVEDEGIDDEMEMDERSDSETEEASVKINYQSEKVQEKEKIDSGKQGDSFAERQSNQNVRLTPLAREKLRAARLSVDDIVAGLKKISASDVDAIVQGIVPSSDNSKDEAPDRTENRAEMSRLRKKLSQRLVKVKNETAMLTTFNEVDMSAINGIRKKYQDKFIEKHEQKLGLMSFFLKAAALVLKARPMVNSMIDGDEIVTPRFVDISVAVQTPKGLMVPVIRNVDKLSLAEIEYQLKILADKARSGKISIDEMSGGTFTITNGGVFGSMLSTPLINPPQSAILGMHNIVDRPVALDGEVKIRPIMYVARCYDHLLIDGKDSVSFLADVKNMLEKPELLFYDGGDPFSKLLGI
jgi:2-oxoglutarate dehydrogenase E2 component (dihydrolipoamide succinyltransferase)